jgi:hypothetical protein
VNIEAEAATWFENHRPHRHVQPVQTIPTTQENHMTTPQPQQPTSVVDSLHAITGEIQANQLVARLVQYGIGKLLTPKEADSIVTLIAGIEQPRAQVAANVPHDHDAS